MPLPALKTPDSEARSRYYRDSLQGTPTIFFNGKSEAGGGGPREAAGQKYKEYLNVLKPLLDAKAKAEVSALIDGLGFAPVDLGGLVEGRSRPADLDGVIAEVW